MRDYELRRGHWKNIEGEKLLHLLQDVFSDGQAEGKGFIVENFGALSRLYCEQLGKTHVRVDTTMNPKVASEEAQKTLRAYNDFLELATGYDAKQRSKRAQAEAKKTSDPEIPEDA